MIDTNALLSIGFSIVAGFSNVVQIPHGAVPTKPEDLRRLVMGGPPPVPAINLHLVDRRGTQFSIRNGSVDGFSCGNATRVHGGVRRGDGRIKVHSFRSVVHWRA